ncbi:calcium-binding protein [Streptomyces sp. NBC_00386]|jgi:Ca2+-binding RTX toxin-like protein|uniref:calcium-binding protein n=1 Tax=Streptomyces sp. NBC_00386 TaxID=2975734 RepID=UPI002E1B63E0
MRTLRTISATAALALALGGSLFSVSAAQAATASSASIRASGGALWYSAGAGQANNLTVTAKYVDLDPSAYGDDVVITFRDKFDITIPTSVCRYPSATNHKVAECTVDADDSDRYGADLGDGNDTATVTDVLATISGGKGNDVIKGDSGAVLFGDDGNDRIDGGGGLYGEGSFGGAGNDTMTNCEDGCSGGPGNDSLTGTATGQDSNGLFGGDGDDVIHGAAGADVVDGGNGNDKLYGGSGNDKISGGRGNDKLYGDSGNDKIYGNSGNDLLHGGTGTDTLSGGPGTDKVYQS